MKYQLEHILPEFPRTKHLPYKANASSTDRIAEQSEVDMLFVFDDNQVTEKIDGANCGMTLYRGEPMIRNRNHILKKGYNKDTPAKKQFAPIFGWWYQNYELFERLNKAFPTVSVYGEWMYAQHGMEYDKLPSLFIAYDLYDYEMGYYIRTDTARAALQAAGFAVVPQLFVGKIPSYEFLYDLTKQPSEFTSKSSREGIYIKSNAYDKKIHKRFKMVRGDFKQGELWDHGQLKKNKVIK